MRHLSASQCDAFDEFVEELVEETPASAIAVDAVTTLAFLLDEEMQQAGTSQQDRDEALRAVVAEIEHRLEVGTWRAQP